MMKTIRLKIVAPLLFLSITSACLSLLCGVSSADAPTKTGKSSKAELRTPLSLRKIAEIERNIPKLKVGMPAAKVLPIIGLTQYSSLGWVMGSGPTNDYRLSYHLRKGYGLTLVYDFTKKPATFKRAVLNKPR